MDSEKQKRIQDRLGEVFAPYWAKEQPMAEQPIATQDWHTRALVRILETTTKRSFDGEHTFHAGEELEMVQWGRAGRPIDRSAWWTSYDIDGAFIIESDKTEIVRIIDEVAPIEDDQEPTLVKCPWCGQMHESDQVDFCPKRPKQPPK